MIEQLSWPARLTVKTTNFHDFSAGFSYWEAQHHKLGIRVLSLGGQAMQGMALREIAIPHLRSIVDRTRPGAHLAILDHGDAVYIERVESPGFIKMDIWVGRRVAPQLTAIGKALNCHLDPQVVQEITARHRVAPASSRTILKLPRLLEELARLHGGGVMPWTMRSMRWVFVALQPRSLRRAVTWLPPLAPAGQ
jgi:DNA-binding IclR family transcriptional regulator